MIDEKRKRFEEALQNLIPEPAQQQPRSGSLNDLPEAHSPMLRKRRSAQVQDELYGYADLLLKERTRKELWQAFPDDRWGRDHRSGCALSGSEERTS
jgi:hypothetical protein